MITSFVYYVERSIASEKSTKHRIYTNKRGETKKKVDCKIKTPKLMRFRSCDGIQRS